MNFLTKNPNLNFELSSKCILTKKLNLEKEFVCVCVCQGVGRGVVGLNPNLTFLFDKLTKYSNLKKNV